jgi:hypothetical protein
MQVVFDEQQFLKSWPHLEVHVAVGQYTVSSVLRKLGINKCERENLCTDAFNYTYTINIVLFIHVIYNYCACIIMYIVYAQNSKVQSRSRQLLTNSLAAQK